MLSPTELTFALAQRVARLATADASGKPHAIPVCFAYAEDCFWIPIDEKPKRSIRLKRLRNIAENPRVTLLFDHWDEDWSRLAWLMVEGMAEVLETGAASPHALSALRERYPQYRAMDLEARPLIRVSIERTLTWGALD